MILTNAYAFFYLPNDPTMNLLSPDIICTILSYVKPKQLRQFHKSHQLNTNYKFKYNSYNVYRRSDISKIFDNFPNIILKNITLEFNYHIGQLFGFKTSLLHVEHIHILFNWSNHATISDLPKRCPAIKSLEMYGYNGPPNNHLKFCTNLRIIKIMSGSPTRTFHLHECPVLRHLEISNMCLGAQDVYELSICPHLISLKFTKCSFKGDFVSHLNFTKLRTFMTYYCSKTFNHALLNCKYDKLTNLVIETKYDVGGEIYYDSLRSNVISTECDPAIILLIGQIKSLKQIIFSEFGKTNVTPLIGMINLKTLRVNDCEYL